jgi:phosphoribosylformylglycinamidine synthase subunit PurSL
MKSQGSGSRFEVVEYDDLATAKRLGATAGVEWVRRTEVYFVDRNLSSVEQSQLSAKLLDAAIQSGSWPTQDCLVASCFAEIALRAGVTDPAGEAFARAAGLLGVAPFHARSGTRFEFPEGTAEAKIRDVAERLLRNDVVDEVSYNTPITVRFSDSIDTAKVEILRIRGISDEQLFDLSRERRLSLDPEELVVLRAYFESIDRDPTDAEVETVAQTWSEHCSHKTFRAHITWDDGAVVEPLLKQLRRSTDEIAAPWVKSAFIDNAGIIGFDDDFDVAVKVETHNHPSAVEPFGGANTGVGGVIRDVLGVAADAIAVTNILCFGPLDMRPEDLPAGTLHPRRIREGVIAGIADYGNKLGIPTVAGAIAHQEGFTANPLVFAGCIGLRPAGLLLSGQQPGDRIVVLGGATGRDGIRGATFSSETMDASTGDVAGASVQIGDPIVEKLVADVLTEARNANLFTAITDCGAGGFSSAIGEIAAELGADVDLDLAPRKYTGLAPWEVWLSEAQERMVLAVHPSKVEELRAICNAHGVSMADLGGFRSDGQLIVSCGGQVIVDLPGGFLHDGRPQRHMIASHPVAHESSGFRDGNAIVANANRLLLAMLAHPDVRSNEDVVRRFDHEILGATISRPYQGAADDGPSDAAVLAPLRAKSGKGLAIGIGMNCRTGAIDSRRMAEAVVDEAIRNSICVGADPNHLALLDNFSWGNPRRPEMLGHLVDAVAGCVAAANAHQAPFVSGKDSLNNEYETRTLGANGEMVVGRRSIPPTLVITALGVLSNAEHLVTSDAKQADNLLILTGAAQDELRGSILDAVLGVDGPGFVPGGDPTSPKRYRTIHQVIVDGLVRSAHDVSDGGLLVALAEMAMGGRLGISVDLTLGIEIPASDAVGQMVALFSESSGQILLECRPEDAPLVCERTGGRVIGQVTSDDRLVVRVSARQIIDQPLEALLQAWQGHIHE